MLASRHAGLTSGFALRATTRQVVRSTDTDPFTPRLRRGRPDAEILPPRPCGGKNINRFAMLSMLMPERHDAFAWAEPVPSEPSGGVGSPRQKVYIVSVLSRVLAGSKPCAKSGLRLNHLLVHLIQRGATAHSTKLQQIFWR